MILEKKRKFMWTIEGMDCRSDANAWRQAARPPCRQEWGFLFDLAAENAINWFVIKFLTRHISVNSDWIELIFILKCSWGFSASIKFSRLGNLFEQLLLNNKKRLNSFKMTNTHNTVKKEIISDGKNWNSAKNFLIACSTFI